MLVLLQSHFRLFLRTAASRERPSNDTSSKHDAFRLISRQELWGDLRIAVGMFGFYQSGCTISKSESNRKLQGLTLDEERNLFGKVSSVDPKHDEL